MDISCFDNKILIINDNMKKSLLEKINSSDKLLNIKIITLSELVKKYFFDYDKETIYYVCKKYNVISEIAKIYLKNLYYIGDIEDEKIVFLNRLKKDLEDNNLLYKNELFKTYIENSEVVLFNLKYVNKFYNRIFDNLKYVTRYDAEEIEGKKLLVRCNNRDEEVSYIASSICDLIKSGVDINSIKLSNVSSEYKYIIKNIFKMFNIPVNLKTTESIKGTKIVKVFKENFDLGIEVSLNEVKALVKNEKDTKIYKQLINIVNSYSFIQDYSLVKDQIFNDIDESTISVNKLKNAVEVIDIENEIITGEYVFLMNYTEGVIPVNHKDEDYLSDKVKSKLNISMSYEENKNGLLSLISSFKRIKNLIVTFPSHDEGKELYISSSYNEELFNECSANISFNNSNLYNKLRLVSLKDDNKKYGIVTHELLTLNNHYKNESYLDYDNKFSGIDKNELYDFLQRKLTLSYTSLSDYNGCAFKYYLDNVLKINKFEDRFETTVGTIFHNVLSECFNESFDFDESFNASVSHLKYEFSSADEFFLEKLKGDLQLIIETIKNQLNYTQLDKFMYEKEIKITINEELNITFKGFVDKIMYKELPQYTVVAIIDYKTGNPSLTLNNCVYGLDMQLPIYMYLIKNSNLFNNVRIGGLYLQKILNNAKTIEEKQESLKLQGYSNSDENVLSIVDTSFRDSNIIKSLKVKNDGNFYYYSKVLSDQNMDDICKIVKEKINETSKNILDAKFDINPKKIGKTNKGCMYCKYKDICYMKNEDIVSLEEVNSLFGGEENE